MNNRDLKIICVDDEPEIIELISQVIVAAGFSPLAFTNPKVAVDAFKSEMNEIALVISDFHMPEMNGFELRAALLPDGVNVPFVIVSSFVTKEMALNALSLKIDAFYDKPFNEGIITAIIDTYAMPRVEVIRESQLLEGTFIEEASALIDDMDTILLGLEHDRSNQEQINLFFRSAHTIKGSSGVLSCDTITRYVHRYEDIISSIKKGELEFTDSIYDILLQGFDRIKQFISATSQKRLKDFHVDDCLKELEFDSTKIGEKSNSTGGKNKAQTESGLASNSKARDTITVPISLLEKLSDCSGEITVIRNMINKLVGNIATQNPGNREVQSLCELLDEMHKVNGIVQTGITDLRKVPIANVLKTIPRIIRDLAKELGKSIQLKIEGEKLRIDNSLANVLSNSLVHLVRNSVDHGIEDTHTRIANAKPETATITIVCREIDEMIEISIRDDGRGIDPQRISNIAVEKGLFTLSQICGMSKNQILAIIFNSGFSTTTKVTEISGRGVGMDMVKSSVDAVGGQIIIESEVGRGTTFTLQLPIPKSVVIITSLIVESAGRVFALPQDNIQRIITVSLADSPDVIQMASLGKTFRQGEKLYPLLVLGNVLGLVVDSQIEKSESLNVLILKAGELEFALLVSKVHDTEEIVVKSMKSYFNPASAFLGATFMGDGSVGLILDVAKLASIGGIANDRHDNVVTSYAVLANADKALLANSSDCRSYLLFKLRSKAIFGVPLDQVFRLEDIEDKDIRLSGAKRVVIYRGSVMPLLSLEALLGLSKFEPDLSGASDGSNHHVAIIVAKVSEGYFGLEVASIIDIANYEHRIDDAIRDRQNIMGNMNINNQNVTIVDLVSAIKYHLYRDLPNQIAA